MSKLRIVISALVGVVSAQAAEPAMSLDLTKAIQMALEKNFSIEAQRLDPKIARERERSAWGRFDPQLDLSVTQAEGVSRRRFVRDLETGVADFIGFREVTQTTTWSAGVNGVTAWGLGYDVGTVARRLADQDIYETEIGFSLRQPLLRGAGADANLASVRTAQNNIFSSQWALKRQLISVVTDVISVYNELHFAKGNLVVAQRSQELARQLLKDNIKRVEIGVMKPLDVTTAQAEVAGREEAVLTATRRVKDQENFLKQLITADLIALLGRRIEITPPTTPGFKDNVLKGVAQALEMRPDYQQAKLDLANRRINLAFEKDQVLPRLDLTASFSLNGISGDFGTSVKRAGSQDQSDWSVGAIFSFPIGNREARGRVNAEQLGVTQALISLKQLEQQIIVDVDNARGAVVTARERIEATEESFRLAKESLDAGEKRLVAGTSTVFEVLELQEKLASAATSALRAKADFNTAVANYHQLTGTTLAVHRITVE